MSVTVPEQSSAVTESGFTESELADFQELGYFIARNLCGEELRQQMLAVTRDGLTHETGPIEYEADVHYPGSPESRNAAGGRTVRRLQQAFSRHPVFNEWITQPALIARLQQLLGPRVVMPLAHHNCIMTKQPKYSSDTGWHQDIRYWAFQRPELVSVWLALGAETRENGCLRVIPGTHRMAYERDRLDPALFLRDDDARNLPLIEQQVYAELQPGDVLFFHGRTFHAATRNFTDQTKMSVVFTFRPMDNPPMPGTRSASAAELLLPELM